MLRRIDDLRVEPAGEPGLRTLVEEFRSTVDSSEFPCIFSRIPFATAEIYFALRPHCASVADEVHDDLRALCARIREEPDAIAVIFIQDPVGDEPLLSQDLALARHLVRSMTNKDDRPTEPGTPEPDSPHWEFVLDDIGLFLNFSSPRHRRRRSRNVGSAFTLIAQARESFHRKGRSSSHVRTEIRSRLLKYDSVPPHPCLGAFGDPGNREVFQYFLGDGTEPIAVTGGPNE